MGKIDGRSASRWRSLLASIPLLFALSSCQDPYLPEPPDDPASGNADLASLHVNAGVLVPAFSSAVTAYTVEVDRLIDRIVVRGTAADGSASLSAASGTERLLEVGDNVVIITVTAEDGVTTKSYTVTVRRAGSADAALSGLSVSEGILVPDFDPERRAYTVLVPATTASIVATGSAADPNASVSPNNASSVELAEGVNTIALYVTAEDGVTVRDYSVTVIRLFSLDMIDIPAGRFQRDGSASNISEVSAFMMGAFEITRAQFSLLMGRDPSDASHSGGMSDPVQNVSWYQAVAFCNKLSLAEGLDPVYSSADVADWARLAFDAIPTAFDGDWVIIDAAKNGYRLPTEMEWMWASMGAPEAGRSGGTDTSAYLKPFAGSTGANSLEDYAWYYNNSNGTTHPVGTKLPNELGLYDMSGNVGEWCSDLFPPSYPSGTLSDYFGSSADNRRNVREGNWNMDPQNCSVATRNYGYPYSTQNYWGFRVVRR